MSEVAHQRLNLQEFKRYGIIDYVEGTRKKPEDSADYDKLTPEEKVEIEPKVTTNYFKLLQAEVAELKTYSPQFTSSDNSLEVKRGSEDPDSVGYNLWNISLPKIKQLEVELTELRGVVEILQTKLSDLTRKLTERGKK